MQLTLASYRLFPWHLQHPSSGAHLVHLLHHLPHVVELFDELIEFLDAIAAAFGNAGPAGAVEQLRVVAFFRGHG